MKQAVHKPRWLVNMIIFLKLNAERFRLTIRFFTSLGLVAAGIWFYFTVTPAFSQYYIGRFFPSTVPENVAAQLLNALVQVQATFLGFFGLIFAIILNLIQSHIRGVQRVKSRMSKYHEEIESNCGTKQP